MMRRFEVSTPEDAAAALEVFNAFHDGFVAQLQLVAHDRFEARGVHVAEAAPDLELRFAHYNYERDTHPIDQQVRVTFFEVGDLAAAISGRAIESAVQWLAIEAATRVRDGGAEERCLRATLVVSHLNDQREWERRDALAFSFARALFEEL